MGGQPTSEGGKFVKEAIEKGMLKDYQFKLTLAKVLFEQRPELFTSVDQVRTYIKYYTGQAGDTKRKHADNNVIPPGAVPMYYASRGARTHVIPTAIRNMGVISDVHLPFWSEIATNKALTDLRDRKIQGLLLNGDIIDCGYPSRWPKDNTTPDFSLELAYLYDFIDLIRSSFPEIPIWYKIGNHEERVYKQLWDKTPWLANEITFVNLAGLHDFGVVEVGPKDKMWFVDLRIMHGHEIRAGGKYPARNVFNSTNGVDNILAGHHHCTEVFKKGGSKRVDITGCLCNLEANYDGSSEYRWNHGYAYIERYFDTYKIDNVRFDVSPLPDVPKI